MLSTFLRLSNSTEYLIIFAIIKGLYQTTNAIRTPGKQLILKGGSCSQNLTRYKDSLNSIISLRPNRSYGQKVVFVRIPFKEIYCIYINTHNTHTPESCGKTHGLDSQHPFCPSEDSTMCCPYGLYSCLDSCRSLYTRNLVFIQSPWIPQLP